MNIQPSIDLKKVNLQTAVGYLVSLHENEYQWNLLGIRVVGVAPTEADIPTGTYEYGDAYEVGTEPPYDLYIYTRPDGVVHTEGYWFNTGKFPMPGPKGDKGDGWEQIFTLSDGSIKSLTYSSTSGADVTSNALVSYKDSTTGNGETKNFTMFSKLPIIPGKYISMNSTSDNKKVEVKVDDTALTLDYIKIDKTQNDAVPVTYAGKINWNKFTSSNVPSTIVYRDSSGSSAFNSVSTNSIKQTDGKYKIQISEIYFGVIKTSETVQKTATDTGTISTAALTHLQSHSNTNILYDNQVYYRYDPLNAPNGTLNYIHLDSIDDGNGGNKATGKCFSVTVSTREWKVFDLDFGGSTRTTHNLTLTNSSTGMSIYFSLTNNRPETYEGAPEGLLTALESSTIACTVDANGTYSAGMITTDGTNFKATYGNGEEALIEQMQVSITDSMV